LSLYVLKMTGSGTSFAINILIGMFPKIFLSPFAGVLSDRANRKKMTVILDMISGLAVFTLIGLTSMYGLKIIFIYITGFLLSSINAFYDTALTASLPNLVRNEKLMKINSLSSTSTALSGMISPVLAGIIYSLAPIKLFLILNGISFLISSVLEMRVDFNLNRTLDEYSKATLSLTTVKNEMKEVMVFFKNQKTMYSLLKYVLMINLFLSASITVVYPYIINKVLKLDSSLFGAFQSFYFVGMILCSIVLGSKKEKEIKMKNLARGLASIGVIILIIGIPSIGTSILTIKPILIIYNSVLLFLLGVVLISINTPMMVLIQKMTPENLRGRTTGVLGTLTNGITPLGILLAGFLIDKMHPIYILIFSGLWIITTAVRMNKNELTF